MKNGRNGLRGIGRAFRRRISNGTGSPALVFVNHLKTGRRLSPWKAFAWSIGGLIPTMDDIQVRDRFGEEAFSVLTAGPVFGEYEPSKPRKRTKHLKRRKRRLMPHDYAFLLRESGRKYESVPDPNIFLNNPRNGHKRLTIDEIKQKRNQELQEWWCVRDREIKAQKRNASERRAEKKLRRFREELNINKDEHKSHPAQPDSEEYRSHTAYLTIRKELYRIIVCGECSAFNWVEKPGQEDKFIPDESGPVERIAVRPPGSSEDTPWMFYELKRSRRFHRETGSSSEWVWEIVLGDRIIE